MGFCSTDLIPVASPFSVPTYRYDAAAAYGHDAAAAATAQWAAPAPTLWSSSPMATAAAAASSTPSAQLGATEPSPRLLSVLVAPQPEASRPDSNFTVRAMPATNSPGVALECLSFSSPSATSHTASTRILGPHALAVM